MLLMCLTHHDDRSYYFFSALLQQETIPTYFGNPIVFASFLRKLQRWGFTRVSSRRSGRYEFCLPTFRRLGADSAPTASADGISFWKVAKASWWWSCHKEISYPRPVVLPTSSLEYWRGVRDSISSECWCYYILECKYHEHIIYSHAHEHYCNT